MNIPKEIQSVIEKLEKSGFEAYVVGGSVRDFLLGKIPKDWDITTNAMPKEIQKVFSESFYNNKFGTVTVVNKKTEDENLKNVEITTFRIDADYSDNRHPDAVKFTPSLKEDLVRRDFTVNAMAVQLITYKIVDLFDGRKDLEDKIIRAVGDPNKRFNEDALRMLRAIRFSSQLGFKIEKNTFEAIQKNSGLLKFVSQERIRDEFEKIILSDRAYEGVELLRISGLLSFVVPELESGIGVSQNRHHIYTIYEHCALSLKHCPSKKLEVRLAALFHDIAKPQTKAGTGPDSTFYNHDFVGAKFARKILTRLKFSNKVVEKVSLLVKNHMFYYNVDEVSEAGVRRLIRRTGKENLKDLMDLRIADRLGSGVPKAKPYKLRHLEYLIEKVSKDPISAKMLKVNGQDIMKVLNTSPGPKIGAILKVLLSEVIEDPKRNTREYLEKRVKELNKLSAEEIKKSEKVIKDKKEEEDLKDKKKFWVK
ncbi:MAG: HD domain-containing protein [Patescibacteria group bacterium]|nr:HD domain-containing protein [Patescibacteria group bacterium]MEA2097560.1 HD domain-containing protein [Patescibacteria group bacterium]